MNLQSEIGWQKKIFFKKSLHVKQCDLFFFSFIVIFQWYLVMDRALVFRKGEKADFCVLLWFI